MAQDDPQQAGQAGEDLDASLRKAAERRIEDQGAEGGLTEATHGAGEENPVRREGDGERPA